MSKMVHADDLGKHAGKHFVLVKDTERIKCVAKILESKDGNIMCEVLTGPSKGSVEPVNLLPQDIKVFSTIKQAINFIGPLDTQGMELKIGDEIVDISNLLFCQCKVRRICKKTIHLSWINGGAYYGYVKVREDGLYPIVSLEYFESSMEKIENIIKEKQNV